MNVWKKVLSLSMGMLLAGAAVVAQAQEEGTSVEKNVVYLTTITPDQSSYKTMEAIVAAYQEEVNPGFTMEIQYIADKPSYLQKIKTLAAADSLPDMFNVDADAYTNILLENGLIQDITGVIEDNGLDEVFLAAPLAWGRTSDGVQIAVPIDYSIEVFWYNKKMFADAGVEIPQTFDEFLAACETLKSAGYTPIAIAGKEQWPLLRYIDMVTNKYGDNQYLFDFARNKVDFSGEIGTKGAQFLADLGQYFQEGFASTDYTGALECFTGGNAAIYYMGTWDLNYFMNENLSEEMQDNVDYFLLPTVNEGDTEVGKVTFAANSTMPIGFGAAGFDEEMERFIVYYANNVSRFTTSAFSCAVGGSIPYDCDLANRIAADMETSIGAINLYDVELDPTTNELIGNMAISLALGDITVEDFTAQVDASIDENSADYFG